MPTPIKQAYRRFRFLFEREPWMFEVIFGCGTTLFFFLAWADWRDGPSFGSLRILSEVRPEAFWHWTGLLGGAAQCCAALTTGTCLEGNRMKWPRWIAAGWLACLWGSMAGGAWLASPWTPTAVLYAACSAANLYVALHVLWESEYHHVRRARN